MSVLRSAAYRLVLGVIAHYYETYFPQKGWRLSSQNDSTPCAGKDCRAVFRVFNVEKARSLSDAGTELWAVDAKITRIDPADEVG